MMKHPMLWGQERALLEVEHAPAVVAARALRHDSTNATVGGPSNDPSKRTGRANGGGWNGVRRRWNQQRGHLASLTG